MARVIKLQPNYVANSSNRSTGFVTRPKLTLSGKWMQEAGFMPSNLVNVEVQFGKLVITSKEFSE
jgi:hypothetical protein